MLHDHGWCDLKDRRRDLRLALLYKIVTVLRYSFAVRTVSDWNHLTAVVVEQENPAASKAQLVRCAHVRMS